MSARNPMDERRAEWRVTLLFLLCAGCAVGLAAVYAAGGQPQLEGLLLGGALLSLGVGFVSWAKHLLPQGPAVEDRHPHESTPADERAVEAEANREGAFTRRKLLVRSLGLAVGALGTAALFPIRSLGPNPGRSLDETVWKRGGLRLVTADGRPVRAGDVPSEGLVTVFPEGHPGSADGQAVLLRVEPDLLQVVPGRESWAPDGLVAYSKICTHAGCPVGLYQPETHELLCPCHQSAFDVLRAARPVVGPAGAPLPQLPLELDADGYLVATGDFSEPVGPAFWRRS